MKKILPLFFIVLFTIKAQSISIVSPDSAKNIEIQPVFTWSADTTGIENPLIYFQIYYDQSKTLPLLTNPVILPSDATEYKLSFMLNYGSYYWWDVKIGNDADSSGSIDGTETFVSTDDSYFKTIIDLKPVLSYPVGGVYVYTKNPVLNWYTGSINTGIVYHIELDTDKTNLDQVPEFITTQNSYTLNNLIPGETYYWRVRSVNNLGDTIATNDEFSAWSEIDSFKINENLGVVKPVLTFPINDVTVYSKTPSFFWYSLSSLQNINYQVFVFEDGGTPVLVGTTTNMYFNLPNSFALEAGKRYEWFVRAYQSDSTNYKESDHHYFNTYQYLAGTPLKPITSYPVDSAIVYDTKTTLYWYLLQNSSGLNFYLEYRKDNSNFGTPGDSSLDISTGSLSKEITGLKPSTVYYWRVKSYTGSNYNSKTAESEWSDTAVFQTDDFNLNALRKPVNFYPTDSLEVFTSSTTLSWTYDGDLTGIYFNVIYSNNDSFVDDSSSGKFKNTEVSSTLSHTINNLQNGVTYYWKVLPILAGSPVDYNYESDPTSFTFKDLNAVKPLKPILSQPSENMSLSSKTVYFSWYIPGLNDGLKYKLEVALDGWNFDPSNNHSYEYLLTETHKELTLPETGNYKWRVTSYLNDPAEAEAKTSDIGHFVVLPQSNLIQPIAGNPAGGVSIQGEPELSWFLPKSAQGLNFELEISENENMSSPKIISGLDELKTKVNLEEGKEYFWRVRSVANNAFSQYSAIESFKLISPTDVNRTENIPVDFKLNSNYPNPFNPSTNISFVLPKTEVTKLKIYDILGNEIITLVNKVMEKGSYTMNWNGRDKANKPVSSGIYFARLISGENRATIKMLLLK